MINPYIGISFDKKFRILKKVKNIKISKTSNKKIAELIKR